MPISNAQQDQKFLNALMDSICGPKKPMPKKFMPEKPMHLRSVIVLTSMGWQKVPVD